jgi:phage terminase small subunit
MKGKKTGGRQRGSLNRRTRAIRERLLRDEALTVESTVEAIRRGQNYDARRLFDANGHFRPIHELSEEEAWCVAGFEIVTKQVGKGEVEHIAKVKLIDRKGYVELAARHQGMLTDKVQLDATESLAELLLGLGGE